MSTSLVGLFLTTWNNARAGEARKKIEEDKNEFYDFVQTELMPELDVSMVAAITKLHETVDRFEPAFDRVINRFQTTFDNCTKAFGDSFEDKVVVVANAVDVMGENMDKINENIDLQKKLIDTFKSGELVQGLDRYIEASNNFVSITQSLNKFEEARRMMLAATQEAINIQNAYSDSLKIPREVAVRINQILDRIKDFEESINRIGGVMNRREILGNDVVNAIEDQLKGISKKGKIADKYLEMADGRLEDLYAQQTKVISDMNRRYKEALEGHMDGFEKMIEQQTKDLEKRHAEFMNAIEEKLNIEVIRQEFINLGKLKDIDGKIADVTKRVPTSEDIQRVVHKAVQDAVQPISKELDEIKQDFRKQVEESQSGGLRGLFGRR
jgi:DNA-binding FrmR family transcriptional regulator